MEQSRLLIAIVASFLVFFLWNIFFVDKEAIEKQRQQAEKATQAEKAAQGEKVTPQPQTPYVPTSEQPEKRTVDKEIASLKTSGQPMTPSRIIRVNTPLYTVRISEQGALFKSFVLKNHKETNAEDSPLLDMISQEMNPGSLNLAFSDKRFDGWKSAVYTAGVDGDVVNVKEQPQQIAFSWLSPQGIVVEKVFTFIPDTYMIDLNITIRNGSNFDLEEFFSLSLFKFLPEAKRMYGFEGPSALIGGSLEQIKTKDIAEKNRYAGKIEWIALQDRYFMSNIIPETPIETNLMLFMDENHLLESQYIQPLDAVTAGAQKTFKFKVFFGPKVLKLLKKYGHKLDKAIYFGWFDFIAKPCVWVMNFFYGILPNYGIAIIIMTLLIKMILWPLGNKSYKSMAEMKKIQPLVTELREKYKNDKKKMNEEMMKLYKVYKVNPVGGCLPMVLQIPVFFALYRMLYESIELRHAPFFGWITDLSAPDRLFNFGFSIPFMEPPYGIPVLTIIMGASMFFQQKMSPPPGDPTQAKMMMMMPIVFTVIFINFSSGLVLYWLVSNVISISQQYYVQKKQA